MFRAPANNVVGDRNLMLAVNNLVVNVFVDEGVRTPGTDATAAHVLFGVATVGARSKSGAA